MNKKSNQIKINKLNVNFIIKIDTILSYLKII
jgi:hypothetical protein